MKQSVKDVLENSVNLGAATAEQLVPVSTTMQKVVQHYYDNFAKVPGTNRVSMPLSIKMIDDPIDWLKSECFDDALESMSYDLDVLYQLINAHEAGDMTNTSVELLTTLKQALSLLEHTEQFIKDAKNIKDAVEAA